MTSDVCILLLCHCASGVLFPFLSNFFLSAASSNYDQNIIQWGERRNVISAQVSDEIVAPPPNALWFADVSRNVDKPDFLFFWNIAAHRISFPIVFHRLGFVSYCIPCFSIPLCRNSEPITPKLLTDVHCFVLACPQEALSENEVAVLHDWVTNSGGSLLVLLEEGSVGKDAVHNSVEPLLTK